MEYEWTTNAVHMAGCVCDGNSHLPEGRSTQAGSTTVGLQISLEQSAHNYKVTFAFSPQMVLLALLQ